MGVVIPQVITPSKASGAQKIDGSLKFDSAVKHRINRTATSGSGTTWTLALWVKKQGNDCHVFGAGNASTDRFGFGFNSSDKIFAFVIDSNSTVFSITTSAVFRDNGWYHIVLVADTTDGTQADRFKVYVNGVLQTVSGTLMPDSQDTKVNSAVTHTFGRRSYTDSDPFAGRITNAYLIDGQALEPTDFGFTDPLTNTWKPKKYTGVFNAPISGLGGTVWSSLVSNGSSGSTAPSKAFNGDIANNSGYDESNWTRSASNGDTPAVFDVTSVALMADVTEVKVYVYVLDSGNDNTLLAVNDSNVTTGGSSGFQVYTVDVTGNGLDTIKYKYKNGSGPYCYLTGVTVSINGGAHQELIDGSGAAAGANGFWLPFDGNSPIGKDQSGNGNDWTPINFGGSVALDNPQVSGARPILNTTQGGTQAGVGVFGSSQNVGYAVTVYDDGGGNKYYIDGVKQDTVTGLIRGATYTFDTSDSTVSSHPFRFSATSNGSHGGGSEYTNGVAAITGAATTITVPYNAPNTLYYYCTSHSGMGADITGITTNEKLADQYASDCIFATPFVGIKSDVSPSIACTSTATSLVDYGDPAFSKTKSVFYGGSFYYDGNDGHDLGVINDTDFEMGSSDFCIEGWFNSNTTLDASYWNPIISLPWHGQTNNESQLWIGFAGGAAGVYSAGEFHSRIRDSSGIKELPTGLTTLYNDNTWHHFAVTKNGTLAAIFVDGVLKKTVVTEASLNTGLDDQKGYIATYNNNTGSIGSPQGFYTGYLNDIRIYKGAAKYVGVTTGVQYFVPPSTSPDILPDTPSGVSGNSKLTKITDGGVSFNGSDQHLSIPDSADFTVGSDPFTIEFYAYKTESGEDFFCGSSNSSGQDSSASYSIQTGGGSPSNSLRAHVGDGSSLTTVNSGVDFPTNRWVHVAFVRDGNTLRLFQDGVQMSTTSFSGTVKDSADPFMIGRGFGADSTKNFPGIISNFRFIKGTALYTKNFTPPAEPLTNVTNTKLLCCQSPTSIESSAVGPITSDFYSAGVYLTATTYTDRGSSGCTITNNDSVTSSSAGTNSFGLTTAAAMTGEDRVDINMGNVSGSFFQSEWTLEMFFKKDASDNNWFVGTSSNGSSWQTGWSLNVDGTTLKWNYDDQSGGQSKSTGITINDDTWYFMRVQRTPSTSQSRLYIEVYDSPTNRSGTFDGTVQDDQSHTNNTLKIGDANGNSNNLSANWQFANVMITAGTRRNQAVPTLSSGQRVLNATIDSLAVPIGDPAATTFNPFNTDIHTVRGQETGYATLNPLFPNPNGNVTSDGNLVQTTTSGNGHYRATIGITTSSGKFYFEYQPTGSNVSGMVGLVEEGTPVGNNLNGTTAYSYYGVTGYKQGSPSAVDSAYGATYTFGDVIGVAFDSDNGGSLEFFKNGVSQGVAFSNEFPNFPYYPAFSAGSSTNTVTYNVNFGQKPFKFSPPDGFQPLNAANTRPVKVTSRPDQYVGVTTYKGNNTVGRIIDIGRNADLVWVKKRTAENHILVDTVRGANNFLMSDATNTANTSGGPITGIGATVYNGFIVDNNGYVNASSADYVCWNWKAGGDKNTFNVDDVGYASAAAAGLTAGTLTISGASVGTKQGFSIIKYAGSGSNSTFPHGLTQAPDFYMIKCLDVGAESWRVYHSSVGATKALTLNTSAEASTSNIYFNDTEPTSTVASVYAGYDGVNNTGRNYISYLWHNVPGLQKFGTYEGLGGTANGSFVELGFRPAIVWVKNIDTASQTNTHWCVFDRLRPGFNKSPAQNRLHLDTNDQEDPDRVDDGQGIDILSNGFRVRSNNWYETNLSGATYIYCAWAEAPSVDLYGGGSNAR